MRLKVPDTFLLSPPRVFEVAVQLFFAVGIDDTDVHTLGMHIDSAVELVLLIVEIHPGLLG